MRSFHASLPSQASYIGKKVVVAVKAGGDDPSSNLQLAKVRRTRREWPAPRWILDAVCFGVAWIAHFPLPLVSEGSLGGQLSQRAQGCYPA